MAAVWRFASASLVDDRGPAQSSRGGHSRPVEEAKQAQNFLDVTPQTGTFRPYLSYRCATVRSWL